MTAPVAIQLYSVREAAEKDYASTIRKIAEMGYVGVETAGFPGATPEAARKLFDELGLEVCAAHAPMPLGDNKNAVLDQLEATRCPRLVVPWQPPAAFTSLDGLKGLADTMLEAHAVLKPKGIKLGYHNHGAEMNRIGGRPAISIFHDLLPAEIFFEIDTYWAQVGGVDAVALVKEFGARAPLLHIKDGPLTKDDPMLAAGDGKMDFPAIVKASSGNVEWMIIEIDRCATNMFEAVQKSCKYLVSSGLARGRS
jgi:sugar phosphate isomerase/epimerase